MRHIRAVPSSNGVALPVNVTFLLTPKDLVDALAYHVKDTSRGEPLPEPTYQQGVAMIRTVLRESGAFHYHYWPDAVADPIRAEQILSWATRQARRLFGMDFDPNPHPDFEVTEP